MLQTTCSYRGMVTAPHHLATEAGLRVLRDGGNAIEAAISAASTIAVVYPHMNGIGGDNFWLVSVPGKKPFGIEASGGAAGLADCRFYRDAGFQEIPARGPLAALTVAGAVSGWKKAFDFSREKLGGRLPLSRLLEDAIYLAKDGAAVTATFATNIGAKIEQLKNVPGFASTYLIDGQVPHEGMRMRQGALASTLDQLTTQGFEDFYRGDIGRAIATDLENLGAPIRFTDLEVCEAGFVEPLNIEVGSHRVFNMPPPTQGLASLLILGIFDRLNVGDCESFEYVHGLIEATKLAFRVRDKHVTDPRYMTVSPDELLAESEIDRMAKSIDPRFEAKLQHHPNEGDTVWLGVVDGKGHAVSLIQSLYWEFGSGLILPKTGITWQNRGTSFSLDPSSHNALLPHRRPFHTIQPAMAHLSDGRVMVFGTMGGDGQPQTQAMIFSRHVLFGKKLQASVTAPRWLFGRTWGTETASLRIEDRLDPDIINKLVQSGHEVEMVGAFDEVMGHAGAIVSHRDGLLEGANDPRSNGAAAGY